MKIRYITVLYIVFRIIERYEYNELCLQYIILCIYCVCLIFIIVYCIVIDVLLRILRILRYYIYNCI